ncbi:hypothetical protein Dimus_018442, partial [Dionaea muscipula]
RRVSLIATDGKGEVFEGKRGDEANVPLTKTVDQVSVRLCSLTIASAEEEEASKELPRVVAEFSDVFPNDLAELREKGGGVYD